MKKNKKFFAALATLVLILFFSYAYSDWFGQDTCPSHWPCETGWSDAQRFQAPVAGTTSRVEILTYGTTGGGQTRLAVYRDTTYSHPGYKIWEGTDITYVPGQWCGEDVNTIDFQANQYLWLSFKTSTYEEMCYASGPANWHEWKSSQPFGNPFPNPWGAFSGQNSNRYSMRIHYTTGEIPGGKGIIEPDAGIIRDGD